MLFEEFRNSIDEQVYRFDNNRVVNRVEQLCLKLGIDCRIVEYDFENRTFKYNEREYIPISLKNFIEYLKNKTFIFYPEYNLFVDIMDIEEDIPRWILNKYEVKEKGMTTDEVENYIRKHVANKYHGNIGKPIYVA